jgi:PucR C-terminal helix-turn-helix domain/GGDEF-like domain
VTRRKGSDETSQVVIRAELSSQLREKSAEIETKIVTRIRDLSEPVDDENASYLEGLQNAVTEAVSYGIDCIEKGEDWSGPIPHGVIRQARRSAQDGVRLDTVLRRYAAGNKVLEEFVVAEAGNIPRKTLCRILSDQGPQVDRLMEAVAAEYERELEQVARSSTQRRADQVRRLLSGDDDLEDGVDLEYDFEIWHVGMILTGSKAEATARLVSERLGYRLLHVPWDRDVVWGWLGSTRQPAIANLVRSLPENLPAGIALAIGEPREGLEGWRLTHREAQMALQVMRRKSERFTRGRDVVLLAGILRDETLVRSLLDTYLAPLESRGRLGPKLRETLRVYFSVGESTSITAEDLGVGRHTVRQRIRAIEEVLEQPLHTCNAELRIALQLDELVGLREG